MTSRHLLPHYLLGLALLLCATPLRAQRHRTVSLGIGYMMPNNMTNMEYSRPTASVELASWWLQPDGFSPSPTRLGIKTSFAAIPDAVAGHRIGLVGAICSPLGGRSSRWEYQFGLGFSEYTRPYSLTGEEDNIFIGSLLNCLIDLRLVYNMRDRSRISIALLHTSNGGLYLPNKGFNFIQLDYALDLGPAVSQRWPSPRPDTASAATPTSRSGSEWGLTLSPGVRKGKYGAHSFYTFCYDISLNYQYYTRPHLAFGGTLDLWYNFFDRHVCRWEGVSWPVPVYLSALAYMERFWGPFSIKVGIGPHLLIAGTNVIPFYERVGAYYNFGRNYVGVALNAHAGKAEFIEWSYGLRL